MLAGIVAAQDPGIPPGGLGLLDFVNGTYQFDGVTYDLDEVISDPSRVMAGIGLIQNVADDRGLDGSGYHYPGALAFLSSPIRDFLLAANFSLVMDVGTQGGDGLNSFIGLTNELTPFPDVLHLQTGPDEDIETFYGFGIHDNRAEAGPVGAFVNKPRRGRHLLGMTVTDDSLTVAVDGNQLATTAAPVPWSGFNGWTRAVLPSGNDFFSERAYIRSIRFFNALPDEALQGLTFHTGLPPSNDGIAAPRALTLDSTVYEPDCAAEVAVGDPFLAGWPTHAILWWTFTAPADGDYAIDLGDGDNTEDMLAAVFTGSSYGNMQEIACVDAYFIDPAATTWTAQEGVTYLIATANWRDDDGGLIGIKIVEGGDGTPTGPPMAAHSMFQQAVPLTLDVEHDTGEDIRGNVQWRHAGPSALVDQYEDGIELNDPVVWYSFTAPSTADYYIDCRASDGAFVTPYALTGSSLSGLQWADYESHDDSGDPDFNKRVVLHAAAGITYRIAVWSFTQPARIRITVSAV